MKIYIIGCGAIPISLMRAIVQATSYVGHYRETSPVINELEFKAKCYKEVMNEFLYDANDVFFDFKDWILPRVKIMFSQVQSRRPINNPISGRCY